MRTRTKTRTLECPTPRPNPESSGRGDCRHPATGRHPADMGRNRGNDCQARRLRDPVAVRQHGHQGCKKAGYQVPRWWWGLAVFLPPVYMIVRVCNGQGARGTSEALCARHCLDSVAGHEYVVGGHIGHRGRECCGRQRQRPIPLFNVGGRRQQTGCVGCGRLEIGERGGESQ